MMAWTLDDGTDVDVIRRYLELVATSDVRLTMFVAGSSNAWRDIASELQPFVSSGQIQLANHTYHHSRLTDLSYTARAHEIQRDHDFLLDTFGVDARPFWRPPYGVHGPLTDSAATTVGYTTPVMWNGSLGAAGETDTDEILRYASKYFRPGIILIGHLNRPTVTELFPELLALLDERGLKTATLNDVYLR